MQHKRNGIVVLPKTGVLEENKTSNLESLTMIHPTSQWFNGVPIVLASAFLGDSAWLASDTSQSGHAKYAPIHQVRGETVVEVGSPWSGCMEQARGLSVENDLLWITSRTMRIGITMARTSTHTGMFASVAGKLQMQYTQKAGVDRGEDDQHATATRDSKETWVSIYLPAAQIFY
ncbi:hypothetical protein BJ170DRAFT_590004 [Xylariales sp. AK1849]|nr:hypothetical protein BJ170DRAFT_590004 [Xylariales sp. AK1849]